MGRAGSEIYPSEASMPLVNSPVVVDFLDGHYVYLVEGKEIHCKSGEMLMVEPGEKHRALKIVEAGDVIVIRQEFKENDKVVVEK